jgi:thiamine-phosphate pyrophosphorylase
MKLQFITHTTEKYSYFESARMALEGGCRWIQLRMKDTPIDVMEQEALRVQALCKEYDAIFIIDDQVELAQKIKADGVHLGLSDMPVTEARKILGEEFIIGATANTFDDIKSHYQRGADYIGLGPFRYTTTKKNLSPVLGLQGYSDILISMKAEGIDLPLVAIGGITYNDLSDLKRVGISAVALSGAILNANDPAKETGKIIEFGE